MVEAVKTQIDLDAEQSRKIDAALSDMRKALAASAASDKDAGMRRDHARIARQELGGRIGDILTAAQRPAFEEIRKRLAENAARPTQIGRVFILGDDQTPEGVTIRIGASDGAQTEVVSGLEAGQELIVGGGSANDTPADRRRRRLF
jgi:hypothetical protein